MTADWQTIHTTYTPTATAKWASIVVLNWSGLPLINPLFVKPMIFKVVGATGATGSTGAVGSFTTDLKTSPTTLAVGWHNIAVLNITGSERASGLFCLSDRTSGMHQTVWFLASHHFGRNHSITVLFDGSYHSTGPFRYIRIIGEDTTGVSYNGAVLQVYVDYVHASSSESFRIDKIFDPQEGGWNTMAFTTQDPTLDGHPVTDYALMVEKAQVDLDLTAHNETGIISTGGIMLQGEIQTTGDLNHDGANIGFYGTQPVGKATVGVLGTITPAAPPLALDPTAVGIDPQNHAILTGYENQIISLQQKLDDLITKLALTGLIA